METRPHLNALSYTSQLHPTTSIVPRPHATLTLANGRCSGASSSFPRFHLSPDGPEDGSGGVKGQSRNPPEPPQTSRPLDPPKHGGTAAQKPLPAFSAFPATTLRSAEKPQPDPDTLRREAGPFHLLSLLLSFSHPFFHQQLMEGSGMEREFFRCLFESALLTAQEPRC